MPTCTPLHLGELAKHAPEDYDVMFINKLQLPENIVDPKKQVLSSFKDPAGNVVEIYPWDDYKAAGLSAYVVSDRFIRKIYDRYTNVGGGGRGGGCIIHSTSFGLNNRN